MTSTLSALVTLCYTVGVRYPTTNVAELYKIATIVLRRLRKAFLEGLGKPVNVCCEELGQRGEPVEQPISDVLALYLLPGLVSASELFEGYQQAVSLGHGLAFLQAFRQHSD